MHGSRNEWLKGTFLIKYVWEFSMIFNKVLNHIDSCHSYYSSGNDRYFSKKIIDQRAYTNNRSKDISKPDIHIFRDPDTIFCIIFGDNLLKNDSTRVHICNMVGLKIHSILS